MNQRPTLPSRFSSPTQNLLHWDAALSRRIALPIDTRTRSYWLARIGAHLGDIWLWALIGYALWHGRVRGRYSERNAPFWRWVASVVMATAATSGLKRLLRRERPRKARWLYTPGADALSFPSGHAARMGVNLVWMGKIVPGGGWPMGALALLIGWSRVRLGVHYVGDVLAGYALGAGVSWGWRRLRWQVPRVLQEEMERVARWLMAF